MTEVKRMIKLISDLFPYVSEDDLDKNPDVFRSLVADRIRDDLNREEIFNTPKPKQEEHLTLDDVLGIWGVLSPDMWINDFGPLGWWAVVDEENIVAYFENEITAYRFRLSEINRMLNG